MAPKSNAQQESMKYEEKARVKQYRAPVIIDYGNIGNLTRGGAGEDDDFGMGTRDFG